MTLANSLTSADNAAKSRSVRTVALGLGGGGNDLLSHLMDAKLNNIHCIAADTDRFHLQITKAHSKFLMESLTSDGTRGDAEIGRKLGVQATVELRNAFRDVDILFLLAGMGGGTGGGAAPVFAEAARKRGALVIGLVTKPFHFEHGKIQLAVNSIRRLLTCCDTVILIDNHGLEPSSVTLPFNLSLDSAGWTCCSVIESITHTFANSALSNADLGELRIMLRRGGLGKAGLGHSYSRLGVEEAALKALRNMMALGELAHANGVFVNFAGGTQAHEGHVASALDLVSTKINPSAQLLYGHRVDENLQGITTVTLLATGIAFPYSWGGYRKVPLEIFELEPDSPEDENLNLELELHQLEVPPD